ncbi:MAG TPA: bifunctional rhamnulose-1-phosphate aldolase/short-chain dehydrogenase [Acidobacteriota bacterium]|nr:bifunctional rhamnulose-1-phosphate aldolase/short-chain dehydrogenase [Acidobacteriota bacterium]
MKYLKDLWEEEKSRQWESDPLELLRYRSNLLGADLRITNFAGGNTSSKFELPDPLTGKPVRILAVKGSGGDLGSIDKEGFALLYMDRLGQLQTIYRGEKHEDEMVVYYSLCAFGQNRVAASIDTPLHAFLPYPHVDHLHPDWAIALAASANGGAKLEEFNRRFKRSLLWLPWQRPGFELGMMLKQTAEAHPASQGMVLGGHGLFTWGKTQRECYLSSISIIDELGEFISEHQRPGSKIFGGPKLATHKNSTAIAVEILPYLRGKLATQKRSIAHYNNSSDVMQFVNSHYAESLSKLGTSCPDHFLRTRICPLHVPWEPQAEGVDQLKGKIAEGIERYRVEYEKYYQSFADAASPQLRDSNPSVILVPGLGMFTFGKTKKEARITGEFYVNAIHVMAGATALEEGAAPKTYPQAKRAEDSREFSSFHNYVALPRKEAFRIEYWALEEAKWRRMPQEKEYSRKIFLVVGGGNGIGRATVLTLAQGGAHVMVADRDEKAASDVAVEASRLSSKEEVAFCRLDLAIRQSIAEALRETVLCFGGLDGVINTAAVFLPPNRDGHLPDEQWKLTFEINVTGNYLLADEASRLFRQQDLPAVMVLASSANAVVAKRGSEAYDVSKSAVSHLIRELSVGLAPRVRVNGIAPATVIEGSAMFPRDRVIASLTKYNIPFHEGEPSEILRGKLAEFYSRRTLTKLPITPQDCAEAICWLASERSGKTTGHLIPVDGGLVEAFLR